MAPVPALESTGFQLSNGFDTDEPSRLPPTQSPFVTLLRKGRGGFIMSSSSVVLSHTHRNIAR